MPRQTRGVVLAALLLASCERDAPLRIATGPLLTTGGFGPISYFDDNCARCHGAYGSLYNPTHAQRTDEDLRVMVDGMASGQGNAPLPPERVEMEVAYHRSINDGKPFIAVIETASAADASTLIKGEATPRAVVEVHTSKGTVGAKVEGHRWEAATAAGAAVLEVSAAVGQKRTVLNPRTSAVSHSRP